MKGATRVMCGVAGCVVLLQASRASAQDWPQWRGPNRDAKTTGFEAPQTWPAGLKKQWQVTVGKGVATPALVGERLYVFTMQEGNEVTRCLDAVTGKELWQDKYRENDATGPAQDFSGPRSSPTVTEGKIVTLGVRGMLSCLDAGSGEKLWRKDDFNGSAPIFFTSSSPIVVEGLCIAQLGGDRDGAIVAYDLATGSEKWEWADDGTAYASPVLLTVDGAPVIVAETDRSIVGLGARDGKLLWQTPYAVQGRGYNAATPIVDGQTVIYAGSGRGVRAVKIEKQGDQLAAKDLWSNLDNSVQFNTPVLKNGLLFGLTARDRLFCIDAQTGQTAWTSDVGERASRPGYGSVVDAGPVLLTLNPAAQLVVFEPSGKEFKQLASYKVSEGETYAYPVVAGKRVYIKDNDSVTLWTIE